MWWTIVQTTLVSILVIVVLHQLYTYCKNTYTIKKTKDILGHQTEKYKIIIDEIQEKNEREKRDLLQKVAPNTMDGPTDQELTDYDCQQMDQYLSEFIAPFLATTPILDLPVGTPANSL